MSLQLAVTFVFHIQKKILGLEVFYYYAFTFSGRLEKHFIHNTTKYRIRQRLERRFTVTYTTSYFIIICCLHHDTPMPPLLKCKGRSIQTVSWRKVLGVWMPAKNFVWGLKNKWKTRDKNRRKWLEKHDNGLQLVLRW